MLKRESAISRGEGSELPDGESPQHKNTGQNTVMTGESFPIISFFSMFFPLET